ncbi:hypothetical protein DFH06DRAFT_1185441 [Mycena polygramma]|nr:hypothetical protein DFH06DRAFT_1185441 [Mycena polygramma]
MWDITGKIPNLGAVLGLAIRMMQNLESLVVLGMSVEWARIGDEFSSALLHCISGPSLRRLHLSSMHYVPAALILAAATIPVVSFFYVIMRSGEVLASSVPTPCLRHLELANSGSGMRGICDLLLYTTCLEKIERLDMRMNSGSANYDQRLLTACSRTLRYLSIDPGGLINLPQLPLVLGAKMKVLVDGTRRLPTFFRWNFSQIASALPFVETITLVFVVDPHSLEAEWPDMDHLPILGSPSEFVNRTHLLHLREVHCKLRPSQTFRSYRALFDRFVAAMDSMIRGLQGSGVCVKCTLDLDCL